MASRDLYRRFASLCGRWPKDESKAGRDYAEFFRDQLARSFPHGELGQLENPREVEAAISSLERLANNSYFNENSLKRASASGLESWVCSESVSNKGLAEIQDIDETSLIKRLKEKLGVGFLGSKSDYKTKIQEKLK